MTHYDDDEPTPRYHSNGGAMRYHPLSTPSPTS
jgi:hypothetical protein